MIGHTPHLYALEMYLRELRADGASSGTVRTAGIEGVLGEVADLRRRLASVLSASEYGATDSALPAIEEYLRVARDMRAASGSDEEARPIHAINARAGSAEIHESHLEAAAAEIRGLRRVRAKHEALVARIDKVGMSQIVRDEDIARYAGDGDRFGEHVKKNLLRGLLEGLGERVEFSIDRDDMRAQNLVSATLYVIRPETPAPLNLPAPPAKEIRP